MPNLSGMDLNAAREALKALNLRDNEAASRHEYSETVMVGLVIRTIPAFGEPQPRDGVVELVISLGPPPVEVTPTPTATETPPAGPSRYENLPVRLPSDRQGVVHAEVFQNDVLIHEGDYNTAEYERFTFSAEGYPDDIITVYFDYELAYTGTLGNSTSP